MSEINISMNSDAFSDILNEELIRSLNDGYEQEILNLLFFLSSLKLKTKGLIIKEALKLDNGFTRIIALDYWVNKNDQVVRTPTEAKFINSYVKDLEKELFDASLDNSHWLLIYESKMHGLLNLGDFTGKTVELFNRMLEMGVSFYVG